METCKRIILIVNLVYFLFLSFAHGDFNKLDSTKISVMDFLLVKFDNFFIKNKDKIINSNPFSVSYQHVNYQVIYEENQDIQIFVEAIMDKHRYTKVKKYYPKDTDCNIVRNKIFFDKFGYTIFRRKQNNSLNEEMMKEILINNIFNLQYLDSESRDFLIENTKIKVQVTHPEKNRFITCSGKLMDIVLK